MMNRHATQEDMLTALRREMPRLKREFGVEQVAIYGSFSRGEAEEDSDIDILVQLSKPLGLDFISLAYHLEAVLGREVDLATFDGLERNLKEGRRKHMAENIQEALIYV